MGKEDTRIETIRAALAPHGIFVRGVVGFDGDGPDLGDGRLARAAFNSAAVRTMGRP